MNAVEVIPKFRKEVDWVKRDLFCYSATHRGGTIKYTCGTSGCRAAFSVRRGDIVGPVRPAHNHDPELWIPNRNQMFQNLKARSANEVLDLHAIYLEEAARYPDAAPHLLYNSVAPSMRLWRRQMQPRIPRTLVDYATALLEDGSYRNMYLATVTANGGTAVILGMPGFREILQASETIIADGTFKTVPAGLPAYQILTIHSVISQHYYHPVIAFMSNKRQDLYEAVFRRLWELAENPHPENLMTDYETALQEALRRVTGLPVSGCYFHYTQALTRQARRLHIDVRRNSPGARLVRMYAVLAHLPPERVRHALAELPGAARSLRLPFHNGFHDYFVAQWMTRGLKLSPYQISSQLIQRFKHEKVTPECFSVHGLKHRTSNVAESYHSFLGRNLGSAPNCWRFTRLIKNKFTSCSTRRRAQIDGNEPEIRRNKELILKRHATVLNNNRALAAGIVSLRDYIISTSALIDILAQDVPELAEEVEVGEAIEVAEEVEVAAEVEVPLPHALDSSDEEAEPAPPAAAPGPRCGICHDVPPTRVLIPCGHTMCDDCLVGIQQAAVENQDRCPYCRMHIANCITIYL